MLRGSLRQVSSRGEQCGSVLSAHKGVGRSQPADSLGNRATPWCLAFPPPLHLQVLSVSGQELFPGGHKQTMSSVACLGFSGVGWFGRAPHFAVCMAEGEVEQCPPTSSARCWPWEYYFPAAGWSLETCSHWLQSCSSGSSLATLESRMKVFSSTMQSRGLVCSTVC